MIARISNFQNAVANPSELANDTLRGAEEIAEFLYGDRTQRRKVYHNASPASVNPLPTFRDGNLICARKSTILEWIKAQEVRSMAGAPHEAKSSGAKVKRTMAHED